MRTCVLVIACLVAVGVAACSKKSEPAPAGELIDQMPLVLAGEALAEPDIILPRVVAFLAADGSLTANDRPKSWNTFLADDRRRKAIAVDAAYLRVLSELSDDTTTISKLHKQLGQDAKLSKVNVAPEEPPPPPPEPEEEEPVDDEEGGVGTAMMLDEGKMGKKDGDRAQGQYKMRKLDPQELRRRALESAGVGGFMAGGTASAYVDRMGRREGSERIAPPPPSLPTPPELPRRQGQVLGESLDDLTPPKWPRVLVVAHPSAKATALVDVLAQNAALLAVAHQGGVNVLRVGFFLDGQVEWNQDWQPWIEVRVTDQGVLVEAVPGEPTLMMGTILDASALAAAFQAAREGRGIANRLDVDVLVDGDVDVQRLVDVLVALDVAGARIFGIGRIPPAGSDELAKRGKRITIAQLDRVTLVGGMPRVEVTKALAAATPQVKACYERALATHPELEGKVSTQFFIGPNGVVQASNAAGVDSDLAACVADVMKGLSLPKSPDGGGTQVNAPFILRR